MKCGAATVALALFAGCASQGTGDAHAERVEAAVVPMAQAALAAGQIETARRLYERLMDVEPNSVDARMGLGQVALDSGEPVEALGWYLSAVKAATTPEKRRAALLAHGRAALAAGDLAAARRSFRRLSGDSDGGYAAWGHNGIGVISLLEGDADRAVEAFEQAVLDAPAEARFRENLQRAAAIADARREAEPDPEDHLAGSESPTTEDPLRADAGEGEEAEGMYAADPAAAPDAELEAATDPPVPISPFRTFEEDGIYLQLGAFSDEENAIKFAAYASLRTDVPVAVTPPEGDPARLYRVRVGPIPDGVALPDLFAAFGATDAKAR